MRGLLLPEKTIKHRVEPRHDMPTGINRRRSARSRTRKAAREQSTPRRGSGARQRARKMRRGSDAARNATPFPLVTIPPRQTTTTPCCRHERRPRRRPRRRRAHTTVSATTPGFLPGPYLLSYLVTKPPCPSGLYRRYVTNGLLSRFPYPITSHCMRNTR